MKLINEKEVEEASKNYSELRAESNVWRGEIAGDFISGVNFAEHEVFPMFQEYADWWNDNIRKAELPNHFCIKGQWTVCYKKEQLFEQFLKTRKK